jgi:DNA repair protein RecO
MDSLELNAFVISETDYKDSHKIFTLFTDTHGVLSTVGYGAKSFKNKSSKIGIMVNAFFILKKKKKNNEISFIDEVKIIKDYRSLKYSIIWESVPFFKFLKVIDFETEEENRFIYIMLEKLFDSCKNDLEIFRVFSVSFILKTLTYLKIIYIGKCSKCGQPVDIPFIDIYGDIKCSKCKSGSDISIDEKSYFDIHKMIYSKFEEIGLKSDEIDYFLIDKIIKPKIGKSINEFRQKNPFGD